MASSKGSKNSFLGRSEEREAGEVINREGCEGKGQLRKGLFQSECRETGSIPGSGRSPEEGMGTHSSILAWRIPWTEEPSGLQFLGSQRVRQDLAHTHDNGYGHHSMCGKL